MKSSWWYRFSFLLIVVVVSTMMILPTIFKFGPDSSYPIKSKINLGLDLQGGLYMVLGIDFRRVYRDEINTYTSKIEQVLKEVGISATLGKLDATEPLDPKHSIVLDDIQQLDKAKAKIKDYFATVLRLTHEEGSELQFGLTTTLKTQIENQSVTKSIEVIRNRIDEFGVTEPEIVSQGKDRIVVQLPGVKDIDRAKDLIGKTAKLEFKMVNDDITPVTLTSWLQKAEAQGIVYKQGERFSNYLSQLNEFLRNDFPKGFELAFQKTSNKATNELENKVPYLVESVSKITGDDLQDATVQIDQQKNQPYVSMTFKSAGSKKFEDITGENVGKRMAVILDGNVYTAPVIQQKIGGGNAQITLGFGNFDQLLRQAKDIALVLRAGALPVQLEFEEQRIVGPSLGQDSIKRAEISALIGCLAVFLFMMIYYKISGFLAVITLVVNVLICLACLVGLEATLTLPGIAGIALTVGMAVDGSIIIYERIREEVHKGMSYFKAVEAGFQHAFWAIVDANVTTALAGLCLLNFGTGPIRGFAITLLIGLFSTVYTAYFVGKLLFEYYMHSVGGKDLSI